VRTKEADVGTKAQNPTGGTTGDEPALHEGAELPERWSVQRKTELVVRLLRGEALDAVSRESQIPAHELEGWKRVFRETGTRGLKTRAEPEASRARPARAQGSVPAAPAGVRRAGLGA